MANAPQTINDLEFNKFLEIAGQVGIRVLITHGDGWLPPVTNLAALPPTGNTAGDIRMALDTRIPYVWNGTAWIVWSWASAAWGGISGTLSDQADLQAALTAKMSAGAYVFTSRDSLIANQVNLGLLTTGMLKITVSGGIATPSIVDPANWDAAYTHTSNTSNPHSVTKAQVGLGNVDNTSDANKPVSTAQEAADTTVLNTAKSYADSLVVGLVDDRGNYDASTNLFPSTGGSGTAGAVLKGDLWTISVAGTLGSKAVTAGDLVRALVDTPGQTAGNWATTENNIGYVAENQANKVTAVVGNETSNTVYASVKAIYDWANPLITARALDNAVVHLAGAETIPGAKVFTANQELKGNISLIFTDSGGTPVTKWEILNGLGSATDGILTFYDRINSRAVMMIHRASGNIGIGTSTTVPSGKLHITSADDRNTVHIVNTAGGSGSSSGLYVQMEAASGGRYIAEFWNNASRIVSIRDDGITSINGSLVAVGNTDIGSYNSSICRLGASSYDLGGAGGLEKNVQLGSWNNGGTFNPNLTVQRNGNVGVGTTGPDSRLTIWGRVKITGFSGEWTSGTQRMNWGGDGSGWRMDFGSINNAGTENTRAVSFYDNGHIETTGVILGNTTWATAGMTRWNGTKFQGYNGSVWVDFH